MKSWMMKVVLAIGVVPLVAVSKESNPAKELVVKTVKDKATATALLKELDDVRVDDWVGVFQCKTTAADEHQALLAIDFKKEKRSVCAAETLERFVAAGSSSKDYGCQLLDETFCLEESQFDLFKGHFQKKPQNMPYIHFVDKKMRNQIDMIAPKFFKKIGLSDATQLCREKAKLYAKSSDVKAECIEAAK